MRLNLQKWISGLAVLGISLASILAASAKDAPKPTAPPSKWLKYIHEDIKAPTPRPKETQTQSRPQRPGVGSLSGSRVPMAKDKDAPPPSAPPTVWLHYVTKDYKPPIRPKENQAESRPVLPGVGSLSGTRVPMAKDAPPPTAPPTVWLKYINEDIKAPKPSPKENQTESRPRLPGVSSLSGALPSAMPFPPKRPPYVHPRDLKDFTGDIHKQIQGPPPPR